MENRNKGAAGLLNNQGMRKRESTGRDTELEIALTGESTVVFFVG